MFEVKQAEIIKSLKILRKMVPHTAENINSKHLK